MTSKSGPTKYKRYWVTLSSFAGIVPFASHWWATVHWTTLEGEYKSEGIEHEILHKGELIPDRSFDTQEEGIAAALQWIEENATGPWFCTLGSMAVIDPQPVLAGPSELKEGAAKIYSKFEALGGWGCDDKDVPKLEKLSKQWEALMKKWRA